MNGPYPDSVNRVKPPKTTIPKTLAALPSSQYATILSLDLGKDRFALMLDTIAGLDNGVDVWERV